MRKESRPAAQRRDASTSRGLAKDSWKLAYFDGAAVPLTVRSFLEEPLFSALQRIAVERY